MDISISKDIEPLSEFRYRSADFVKRLKKENSRFLNGSNLYGSVSEEG